MKPGEVLWDVRLFQTKLPFLNQRLAGKLVGLVGRAALAPTVRSKHNIHGC